MKKILLGLMAFLCATSMFVSCGNNKDKVKADPAGYTASLIQENVDNIKSYLKDNMNSSGINGNFEMIASVEPKGKQLLKTFSGGQDFSWFDKISLSFNEKFVDNKIQCDITGALNKAKINLNMYCDDKGVAFNVPDLGKNYAFVSADTIEDTVGFDFVGLLKGLSNYTRAATDYESFVVTVDSFSNILKNAVSKAEFVEDGKLEVGGISEDCSLIRLNVSAKELAGWLKDTIRLLKSDKYVENYVKALDGYFSILNELSGNGYGYSYRKSVGIYDEFVNALDEMKRQLDRELSYMEGSEGDENIAILDFYLDEKKSKSIHGLSVKILEDDELVELFNIKAPHAGGKFAFEVVAEQQTVAKGNGSLSGKAHTGTIDIIESGDVVYSFGVKKLVLDEDLKGSLDFPLEDVSMPGMKLVFEIKDVTASSASMITSLYDNDDSLASIRFNVKSSSAKSISAPSNIVEVKDESSAMEYVKSLKWSSLKKIVSSIGLPKELEDQATQSISMIEMSLAQ